MPRKPQTLDVGEYFEYTLGIPGNLYKVIEKRGNIYKVWSKFQLEPGCHHIFNGCPFMPEGTPEDAKLQCDEEIEVKIEVPNNPHYGGNHWTCFMLNPENEDQVKKVPALKGALEMNR